MERLTSATAAAAALRFLRAEMRKSIHICVEKAPLQLLPPRRDFYEPQSENRSRYKMERPTCSCCPRVTIFTSGEAKAGLDMRWKGLLAAAAPGL